MLQNKRWERKELLPVAFAVTKFHFGSNEWQCMTPVQAALYYPYTQPLIDFRAEGGGGACVSQ